MQTITLREIFTKGSQIYRATRKQTMYISVFGLFLPQFLLSLYFAVKGDESVAALKRVITSGWGSSNSDLFSLVGGGLSVVASNVFLAFFTILALLVSYFALVQISSSYCKGRPIPAVKEALLSGLRFTIPRGLILCFVFLMFSLLAQVIVAPMIIVAILTLMVPVVMVAENRGAFSSLGRGVLLRYARESRFGGWTVMFSLLGFGALFFASMMIVTLFGELLFRLDEWIPMSREFWTGFSSTSFGPVFLIVTFFESALSSLIIGALPSMTCALYFHVTSEQISTTV